MKFLMRIHWAFFGAMHSFGEFVEQCFGGASDPVSGAMRWSGKVTKQTFRAKNNRG